MEVTVVVHHEGEGFWSEVSELPGCFATGRTLDELTEAVGEAVGLYLWDDPAVKLPGVLSGVGPSKVRVSAA
jgi:predicted RNase H-like HicB family nuclease